ncbi:putative pectate lyase, partial [Tanacetum coccineum]
TLSNPYSAATHFGGVTVTMLLARAITQHYPTTPNNLLCTSSNTRNKIFIQDGRVDIQSKNVGYVENGGINSGRIAVNQGNNVENDFVQKNVGNAQRNLRTTANYGKTPTIQCYNCNGKGHYRRKCSKHGLEEINASVIMMACIQPANNDFDVEPTYNFDFVSEVNDSQIKLINGLFLKSDHEQRNHAQSETIKPTYVDDQIDNNIIFDNPYLEVNGGQVEHAYDAHDKKLDIFESLIKNMQLEAKTNARLIRKSTKDSPTIIALRAGDEIIADAVDHAAEHSNDNNAAESGAYNPELFSGKFAGDVEASMSQKNSTRRDLHECSAHNIMDKCWRCKADWADNRKALADCAQGFAKGTTGGVAGEIYTVTCDSDDAAENPKEGTLRWACAQKKPLWIIFDKDMTINLKHTLVVESDKTIDGRGAKIEIAGGGGVTIHNVNNVILSNINVHDVKVTDGFNARSGCDGDAVAVKTATKVWIDHCTMSKGPDGLLDVTVGSTGVTISNCRFHDHDKVLLLGADDSHSEDKNMHVTVAFNRFDTGCTQRMPRCRFGFFQVVNNDYCKWGMYALGGSANPTILSQGNRFVAPDDSNFKKVCQRTYAEEAEWKNWNWRSTDDVLENGAIFEPSGSDPQLTGEQQAGMIPHEPGSKVADLTCSAGVLTCTAGQPC